MPENIQLYKIRYLYDTVCTSALVAVRPLPDETENDRIEAAKEALIKGAVTTRYPNAATEIKVLDVANVTTGLEAAAVNDYCWVYNPALEVLRNY